MPDQDLTAIPGDRMHHWTRWLPRLATAHRYRSAWLRKHIVAGLVLAALVPQGMAGAQLAGLLVAAELITDIDTTAAETLVRLRREIAGARGRDRLCRVERPRQRPPRTLWGVGRV